MGNPKDEKKKIAECQKAIHGEAQKLSLRMRKSCKDLDQLVEAKDKIEATDEIGPKEQQELVKIDQLMLTTKKSLEKEVLDASGRLNIMMQKMSKRSKEEAAALEKGLDKSFTDKLQKLMSFPAGKNLTLRFDIDPKKLTKLKKFEMKPLIELPVLKGKF